MRHNSSVLLNGPLTPHPGQIGQPFVRPVTPMQMNGPTTINTGNQPIVRPISSFPVNGQPVNNGNQADLFSQRLKQLASCSNTPNMGSVPRIINTVSSLLLNIIRKKCTPRRDKLRIR